MEKQLVEQNENNTANLKSFNITINLSFFGGLLGIHRFYTGYIGLGILQFLTFGGLGLWALIDLIAIATNNYKDKFGNKLQGYNKTLGIILTILGLVFFFYSANPYKILKDFTDGYNATETSAQVEPNEQNTPQSVQQTKQKKDLELIEHHPCTGDFGSKMVCGTVINNTNRTIGYAQVEINLYDNDGSLIDSTLDNINNFEPNSKWKFKAAILDDGVASYKIKDITGF